jgi:hypothetical protein
MLLPVGRWTAAASWGCLWLALVWIPFPAQAGPSGLNKVQYPPQFYFRQSWPRLREGWLGGGATDVAVADDRVYISYDGTFPMGVYTRHGGLITTLPGSYAKAFCVGTEGDYYIVYANTVFHYSARGELLDQWGGEGTEPGQFAGATGIALDSSDRVFVLDADRLQRFSARGTWQAEWNLRDGVLASGTLNDVAIDGADEVHVVSNLSAVASYDTDGQKQGQWWWNTYTPLGARFDWHTIGVDQYRNLYLGGPSYRIERFNYDGFPTYSYTALAGRTVSRLYGIAVDDRENVYAATPFGVDVINRRGKFTDAWLRQGSLIPEMYSPQKAVALPDGTVIAQVSGYGLIQLLPDGGANLDWLGVDASTVDLVRALTADAAGHVGVLHTPGLLVTILNSDGSLLYQWGPDSTENAFVDMEQLPDGSFYLLLSNRQVEKRTLDGTKLSSFEVFDRWPNLIPEGLAFDGDETLYIVDTTATVHVHQPDGTRLRIIPLLGSPYRNISGLEVDPATGNLYLRSSGVEGFWPNGEHFDLREETALTYYGMGPPGDIHFAADGHVYVCEYNHVYKFAPQPPATTTAAMIFAGGGYFPGNELYDATRYCANHAYAAIRQRGIDPIMALYATEDEGFDLDFNGVSNDPLLFMRRQDLEFQFSVFPTLADQDQLIVYFTGPSTEAGYVLNQDERLSPEGMDALLDETEKNHTGPIAVVLDFAGAGAFMDALAAPNRTVIASCTEHEAAYFLETGLISFSRYFWQAIFDGASVGDAFRSAEAVFAGALGLQHPQISNAALADTMYVGEVLSAPSPPLVVAAEASMEPGGQLLDLRATLEDTEGVSHASVIVEPPDRAAVPAHTAVLSLPRADLSAWSAAPESFSGYLYPCTTSGVHKLAYLAYDSRHTLAAPTVREVLVEPGRLGHALIVGGPGTPDRLLLLAQKALRVQGLAPFQMRLLGQEADPQNGILALTQLSFADAMYNWIDESTSRLLLYWIGDAVDGVLPLNDHEHIGILALSELLETYQEMNEGRTCLIVDGEGLGDALDDLQSRRAYLRVVAVTCAEGDVRASELDGWISFSQFFWQQFADCGSISDSLAFAQQGVPLQSVLVDANNNGVPDEAGAAALDAFELGAGYRPARDLPAIGSAAVAPRPASAPLSVRANDVFALRGVDAVVALVKEEAETGMRSMRTGTLSPFAGSSYSGQLAAIDRSTPLSTAVYVIDEQGRVSLPAVVGTSGAPLHSADYQSWTPYQINLGELLRLIQFFNLGGFHCAGAGTGSEDGYIAGPGSSQECLPHDSDYHPRDWAISLSELLRLVQLFNMSSYHACESGEDGYCGGAG